VNKLHKSTSIVIVLLLLVTVFISGCDNEKETVKESELTVKVAAAQTQSIVKTSEYSGIIRGVNEVYVMAKVPARVTAINVKPGDYVSQGQTILTLDSTDYAAGIRQAQAAVAMAEAGKKANDAQKETALANYNRMLKLHEVGAVSDAQLEGAKAQYDALNAGSAEAAVEQAQAGLQQAQTTMCNCTVTAPISGVVGTINLSLGETANPQSPAAIISDTSRLEIEVMVSESEIAYVEEDSEVNVTVSAVQSEPFTGKIESAAVAADPMTKNYKVKITMENPDNIIKSGMFAQVAVATASDDDALCVPRNAVIPKGSKSIVYVVDEESRSRMVEVKTGIENSHYIQVLEGLAEGQQVIVKGNTLVNEGTLVRVVTGGEK